MSNLEIWIPETIQAEPSDPGELVVPTIPARNIRSGIIHPDRLPPNLANIEDVRAEIVQHTQEQDPHPQYAPDTHDHPPSSITGFVEAIDDRVSAFLVPGLNVSLDYSDTDGTLTISAIADGQSAGVASFNGRAGVVTLRETDIPSEIARSAALSNHIDDQGVGSHLPSSGITNSHIALGASIDWAKVAKAGSQPSDIGAAPASHTHSPANITGLDEAIDDRVSALLVPGANVSLSYNDSAGTLTISATGSGGGSAAIWGGIGGNLTDQADLAAAFNSKQNTLTLGNLASNTAALSVTGGVGAIIGSGVTLAIANATTAAAGLLSAVDKGKLDGIASGATANQADSFLRNRANHTGTQPISTIDGLAAELATRQSASAQLTSLAGLSPAAGAAILGNGTSFVSRSLLESDIPSIPAERIGAGTLSIDRLPSLANLYQTANDRLSEIANGFSAAGPLTSPRKNAAGTAIEWAAAAGGEILLRSATLPSSIAHTGNTNETQIYSFTIPPNFLTSVGEHIEILMLFSNTGTGNKNYRLRLGSMSGTVIHQVLNSGVTASMNRRLDFESPTQFLSTATTTNSPDFVGSGAPQVAAFDWENGQIIVCSVALATAGDISTLRSLRVRAFR